MSESGFETIYPIRCDGICHLGSKALEMVNGVLGANCPGPRLYGEETLVFDSVDGGDMEMKPTTAAHRDQLACTNPRLVNAVRNKLRKEVEGVIIQSVEMRG